MTAPIQVLWDWMVQDYTVHCRLCPSAVPNVWSWDKAMTWGLGHLSFKHPQWPQSDTHGGTK